MVYKIIVVVNEQILKFHERVISALKFELSDERSQILVVNSCEWMKVLKFVKTAWLNL